MSYNVCIFSDGTGQIGHPDAKDNTNVFRLYSACCFPDGDPRAEQQACYYDAGLGAPEEGGSSPFRKGPIYRWISKATGLGITTNIKDCYDALIARYRPGAKIFLFGFSRGAYTVRSLGGVIGLCGVPMWDHEGRDLRKDPKARQAVVEEAVEKVYKIYAENEADVDAARQRRVAAAAKFREHHSVDAVHPYFIGVWDTVRALGLPGSATLFRWRHEFHNHSLSKDVMFARQALAVDERRVVFAPVPWDLEPNAPGQQPPRLVQAWFAGAHSDIGGGYPEFGLSDVALRWMADEATRLPVPLVVGNVEPPVADDSLGTQHDETSENWFWRRGPRAIDRNIPVVTTTVDRIGKPVVHHSGPPRPYKPENLRGHPDVGSLILPVSG